MIQLFGVVLVFFVSLWIVYEILKSTLKERGIKTSAKFAAKFAAFAIATAAVLLGIVSLF
jgi:hypothetical protein